MSIYLGVSPFYSSTVHLVLNPATGSITPQYHLVFDYTFSAVFSDGQFDPSIWDNLLIHGHGLHPIVQPNSTGSITLPPDCVPLDVPSTPLSSSERARTEEVAHLPTIQPPTGPDDAPFPSLPSSSPLSLDPVDHLDSTSPLSLTEGATTITHPTLPLSSIEGASALTSTPHCSQRSTAGNAGRPPDQLSLLGYDTANQIHRPTLPGSTQTIFHINSV